MSSKVGVDATPSILTSGASVLHAHSHSEAVQAISRILVVKDELLIGAQCHRCLLMLAKSVWLRLPAAASLRSPRTKTRRSSEISCVWLTLNRLQCSNKLHRPTSASEAEGRVPKIPK